MALDMSIFSLNVESIQELETLIALAQERGAHPNISLRINPDVESPTHPYISTGLQEHKFGISLPEAEELCRQSRKIKEIVVVGVGCHIG